MASIALTRRQFLELVASASAAAALPAGCGPEPPPAGPTFLTAADRAALTAFADHILPADALPGAGALGAADYIERLLTVFEWSAPRLWLGGPFSGRFPFPAPDGTRSATFPDDSFETFVHVDRATERAWRLRLYGSDGVAGGGPNDAVPDIGPVEGLRPLFRRGLDAALAAAPAPIETLDPDALAGAFNALDPFFRRALVELVLESFVAPPEYGGNQGGAGWQVLHVDGDVQPFGYSAFDHAAGAYRERAGAPVSTADPGPDPDPLDDAARDRVALITIALGGRVLY
jgi:hypothetical protein